MARALTTPSVNIERIVEDGVLIAVAGVRMAVKNRLIVASLREGEPYDANAYEAVARNELQKLCREKKRDAERTTSNENLKRRINFELADRLLELSEDEDFTAALAEEARASAWEEVSAALTDKVTRQFAIDENAAEYAARRQERLRLLVELDLPQLELLAIPEY